MSASVLQALRESVQEIAREDPIIEARLKLLNSRAALDAINSKVGVGETLGPESCCDEGDPSTDDEVGQNDGSINGDRPDDGNQEKGMDGQYRSPTGELYEWDDPQLQCVNQDDTVITGEIIASGSVFVPADSPSGVLVEEGGRVVPLSGTGTAYHHAPGDPARQPFHYPEFVTVSGNRIYLSDGGTYADNSGGYTIRYHVIDESKSTSGYCVNPDGSVPPWPSDGKCQEALINGQFVPHPSDPDCVSSAPRDYQTMCQGAGPEQECITYIPLADGGHVRVTVDPVTRLPDSNSKMSYYGSDGKFNQERDYNSRNLRADAYSSDSVPGNWE